MRSLKMQRKLSQKRMLKLKSKRRINREKED
jgi:hypothetical protein